MEVAERLLTTPTDTALTDTATGLSSEEATRRASSLEKPATRQRTRREIIRRNLLTLFNVTLFSLIGLLFVVGEFRDAMFVGVVIAANIVIGTWQEIHAVEALQKLAVLSAPTALVVRDGAEQKVAATAVVPGDLVRLAPGEQIVADGRIVEGDSLELDESLLTGESEGVHKTTGDEIRSGSFVRAGTGAYVAEGVGAASYAGKLTLDARTYATKPTPLQLRFGRLLRVLLNATTVLAVALVLSYIVDGDDISLGEALRDTVATVTTIVPAGLLLGITVAFAFGALRVSRAGSLIQDLSAVEALNYVDYVCLDKTGTITANKLEVQQVLALVPAVDPTRSLAMFARASKGESKTVDAIDQHFSGVPRNCEVMERLPFSSARRMSALRLNSDGQERILVMGAPESLVELIREERAKDAPLQAALPLEDAQPDGTEPTADDGMDSMLAEVERQNSELASQGLRGILFCEADTLPVDGASANLRPLAIVVLKDVLRPEVSRAFETLDRLGVHARIISGDNPDTVAALMSQLGIAVLGEPVAGPDLDDLADDQLGELLESRNVFGRIRPDQKQRIVKVLQARGHYVAMTGDGVNDVPALKAADLAVAMESGTSIARGVSGIVLLGDSFKAFVAATGEARSVLGNSSRLTKLFLLKSLYSYAIVLATSFIGLSFPFLPRQGSVTAVLTLGIPALFISISKAPPLSGQDFTRSVLRFAIPAAIAASIASVSVHLLVEGFLDRSVEESRTMVTITLALMGTWFMLQVLGFEGASWRSPFRPTLVTILAALLVALLLWTLYTPWLRDFFDFTAVSEDEWAIIGVAVASGLVLQFVVSRYWQQILDFLIAEPPEGAIRGKDI
jgi:cation-transporting ATPase E